MPRPSISAAWHESLDSSTTAGIEGRSRSCQDCLLAWAKIRCCSDRLCHFEKWPEASKCEIGILYYSVVLPFPGLCPLRRLTTCSTLLLLYDIDTTASRATWPERKANRNLDPVPLHRVGANADWDNEFGTAPRAITGIDETAWLLDGNDAHPQNISAPTCNS